LHKEDRETDVGNDERGKEAEEEPGLGPAGLDQLDGGGGSVGANKDVIFDSFRASALEDFREHLQEAESLKTLSGGEALDAVCQTVEQLGLLNAVGDCGSLRADVMEGLGSALVDHSRHGREGGA